MNNNNAILELSGGKTSFTPGGTIEGNVSWQLEGKAKYIMISLIWHTSGKGSEDIAITDEVQFQCTEQYGNRRFTFTAPQGPYSFSGRLITLQWVIEATVVMESDDDVCISEAILISPTREEIILGSA